MENGCKKCALLDFDKLCIDCRLEQAEWRVMADMDDVERLKKEKTELERKKEKQNELSSQTR